MKINFLKITFITLISALAYSCSSDDDSNTTASSISKTSVIDNYASLVFANYQDAMNDAEALETAINTFTTTPTDVNFTAAKNAWLTARESYGTTEAFRFANGPIDINDAAPEPLLNSWPLDENYIDYVDGDATSGIINNTALYPTISKNVLLDNNQPGTNEASVSVGYHAMEFLLWGQDLTAPSALQAGQRPYTDFVDAGTASNQGRRRQYLDVCADLLTDHLQLMINEWQVGGAYRTEFLELEVTTALSNMLTGIATLSKAELALERIAAPYNDPNTEDEHSCFSDNTHRDVRLNLEGIANIYKGSYGNINGASLEDLITEANPILGAEVTAQLATTETAINATAIPFDFAISDASERPKVLTAINALQVLGDKLVEGGVSIGLNIN